MEQFRSDIFTIALIALLAIAGITILWFRHAASTKLKKYTLSPIKVLKVNSDKGVALSILLIVCDSYASTIRITENEMEKITNACANNLELTANHLTSLMIHKAIIELGRISEYVNDDIRKNSAKEQ